MTSGTAWPPLPAGDWEDTRRALHLFTQVVGKVRLALAPPLNHWWQVPLYVTARGLTTSLMPYGDRGLQIDFDLVAHTLKVRTTEGQERTLDLGALTVAGFYRETMALLSDLNLPVRIWPMPVELPDAIPFDRDTRPVAYDREAVERFRRALVSAHRVLSEFRCGFTGKASPVHFFWGSFDLAVTRFSGRRAPPHPGAPFVALRVMREAYSHEVSSAGWWPGGTGAEAAFYSYAYPQPRGYADRPVTAPGRYDPAAGEFLLPHAAVVVAPDSDRMVSRFLEETYAAAADTAQWDRAGLEREPGGTAGPGR